MNTWSVKVDIDKVNGLSKKTSGKQVKKQLSKSRLSSKSILKSCEEDEVAELQLLCQSIFSLPAEIEDQDSFDDFVDILKLNYITLCQYLHIVPVRNVLKQFGKEHVILRDLNMNTAEIKSLCIVLAQDKILRWLHISGSTIEPRQCEYIKYLLGVNSNISTLELTGCNLNGEALRLLSHNIGASCIQYLNLSENGIKDADSDSLSRIITDSPCLKLISLSNNHLRGGKILGAAIGLNKKLEEINLSWNHIRGTGAIEISKGIQKNACLRRVNVSWNGFGFEGSVALSDMLEKNTSLTDLNISSNRIHPPALLEFVKGLGKNKVLLTLNANSSGISVALYSLHYEMILRSEMISRNPILPAYATIFLDTIRRSPEMAIQELIMEGIVVDKDFESIQQEIQSHRMFTVKFELALPVRKTSLDQLKKEVEAPSVFNVDPLRLLYMLKEKYRAQDFFNKINRDSDEVVSRDELKYLFKDAGIPVTSMVIDKIMEFMDTNNDGEIDLSEFLEGDKKIRKMSREYARNTASLAASGDSYTKYSRTFRKGKIDKMTFRLNIDKKENPLTPIQSRDPSPSPQGGVFDFKN